MIEPAVVYPDAEILVKDYLADQLPDYIADVTVGIGVPTDWVKGESKTHLQVDFDGYVRYDHRCVARAAMRLVAWSNRTTESKALASLALAVLCAHPGGGGISNARPFTGPLPSRDSATGAELAAVTARVIVRSIPLEPLGS